ncbi:DUF2442 domain-containing protein [bacterium]|nr:DUF2442 domain-containing protein [bacterium]MBU1598649.1 DUF2442 domain-containing protein [bacterium]
MQNYPKVKLVVPSKDRCLLVTFDNGVRKLYNCKPLLKTEVFAPLENDWLFRSVQADVGGYGISWGEEIDLSESELWENSQLV